MSNPSFQERTGRKFPPDYRKEIIPSIMERITKGESCFIVGISGTGKSNLFRCLQSRETKEKYLAGQQDNYAFIWADTNALAGELSAFYLYELVLYNLQKWAEESDQQNISLSFIRELHKEVILSKDRSLAQRHLETALRHLFNHIENFHLVLLFDEFEPIARELDFQFFKNLRWLRDEFKYYLSYIMTAHHMPIAIREDFFDRGEPFYELLASNILALKPYSRSDTEFMISELCHRYGVEFHANQNEIIAKLSGGHGGLIVAICKILFKHSLPHQEASQIEQLLSYDAVAGECRKMWNSLEGLEQDTLRQIVNDNFSTDQALPLNGLIAKGVVLREPSNRIAIFSPLFQTFLKVLV